jgi:hypothetical protein
MSKAEVVAYKSKALAAIQNSRATARDTVHKAEVVAGAFLGGYVDEKMPEGVFGIKPSAAGGLLLVGVGIGMKQRDIAHLGLGLLCSFASDQGRTMAKPSSPPSPQV